MIEEMTVLGAHYLTDVRNRFASLKGLADAALEQAEVDFFTTTGPEDNSLAVLVKHLSGNMVSRWGNLSGDGESEARDRDAEFVISEGRDTLMAEWEAGWQTLFTALDAQTADALLTTVTIRGEPHTLLEAINRQLSHYAYHVGQMVFLAKHFRGTAWETLSIPRGGSTAFNERMRGERGAEGDGTQNHRAKDDGAA
jgi:hypothetical protein